MNAHDLLEARASRGTRRGASNVWANAQLSQPEPPRSPLSFRLVLGAFVLTLLLGGLFIFDQTTDVGTANEPDDGTVTISNVTFDVDDLPAPYLLTTHGIEDISIPGVARSGGSGRHIVYAQADDPFDGPVFGVNVEPSGELRSWGINISESERLAFTDQLEQIDGVWQLEGDHDLSEIANYIDTGEEDWWFFSFFSFGGRIDGDPTPFANEIRQLAVRDEDGTAIWRIIAIIANESVFEVERISIAGIEGISPTGGRATGDVVWEFDDFAYHLEASVFEGPPGGIGFASVPASDFVDSVFVAEREAWLEALEPETLEWYENATFVVFGVLIAFFPLIIVGMIFFSIIRSKIRKPPPPTGPPR